MDLGAAAEAGAEAADGSNTMLNTKLLSSLVGNAVLVYLFGIALIDPTNHLDFIYGAGITAYIVEFLTIHYFIVNLNSKIFSMVIGKPKFPTQALIMPLYLTIALAFSFAIGSIYPMVLVLLSLLSKNGFSTNKEKGNYFFTYVIPFFLALFAASLLNNPISQLVNWIPLDQSTAPSIQGNLTQDPQFVLIWGVLYYGYILIHELRNLWSFYIRKYFAGVIPYNPTAKTVFLQLRDGNTTHFPHHWTSFGGSSELIDKGDPVATALRELQEEIGHQFAASDLIPLRQNIGPKTGKRRYIYYLLCKLPKSAFTLGEGEDFDWHPLATVLKLKLSPETYKDLQRLQRLLSDSPALRS